MTADTEASVTGSMQAGAPWCSSAPCWKGLAPNVFILLLKDTFPPSAAASVSLLSPQGSPSLR